MTAFFGPTRPATMPPGNPEEDGAGPEGADEQSGLELAEVEGVDVGGNERNQGAEQQGVEKDDRADDGDEAAHGGQPMSALDPTAAGPGPQKMHRAGLPLRPASRLTFAEASADRGTINLRCSVLGALGNLGRRASGVKCPRRKFTQFASVADFGANFDWQLLRRERLADGQSQRVFPKRTAPQKNAPGRWLPRPAS